MLQSRLSEQLHSLLHKCVVSCIITYLYRDVMPVLTAAPYLVHLVLFAISGFPLVYLFPTISKLPTIYIPNSKCSKTQINTRLMFLFPGGFAI